MNRADFLDNIQRYMELDPSLSDTAWKWLQAFNRSFPREGRDILAEFERWYFKKEWITKKEIFYHKKILHYYNSLNLYSEDSEIAKWFIEEIMREKGEECTVLLATAVSILGKCGQETECQYILEEKRLLEYENERVRANAVEAIGNICLNNKIYDNDDIKYYLKSMLKDESQRVVSTAALSLWLMEEKIFTDEKNVVTRVLAQKRGNPEHHKFSAQDLWENYTSIRPDQMIL